MMQTQQPVECLRCGHSWIPILPGRPKVCANCVCKRWDEIPLTDPLPTDAKSVDGFPGYFVSPRGEVFSTQSGFSRKLSSAKCGPTRMYDFVAIRANGKSFSRTIHTLVAKAFHGPKPSEKHEARHLDGNTDNNSADNIAWGTRSENSADRTRHGRNCGPRKINESIVREIRNRANAGEKYVGIARTLGISRGCVEKVVHKQTWNCVK